MMALKNARIEVKDAGETARDDANQFRDGVIAEQKRLIGLVEPEEKRLLALRDAWDAEEERKKKEEEDRKKAEAEGAAAE